MEDFYIYGEFREFMSRLASNMAKGDFEVMVICAGGLEYPADVVGYDEERMNLKVKFHSDSMVKETTVWIEAEEPNFGGCDGHFEDKKIPVKEATVYFDQIKFKMR
jgi:hypothetical protein